MRQKKTIIRGIFYRIRHQNIAGKRVKLTNDEIEVSDTEKERKSKLSKIKIKTWK